MLLTCGVWSAYGSLITCASWIERLYVWEARVFTSSSLLYFLSPFLFYSWVRLFFLDSMAVYLFVVCMCLCGVVGLLSLSLDRRGDGGSGAGQQCVGRDQGPYCNCGDAEGLEGAITGRPIAIS